MHPSSLCVAKVANSPRLSVSPQAPSAGTLAGVPWEPAFEIDAITHRYGWRTLYRSLSLSVPRDRVVALLRKNGVGKTTLIRLLMGFPRPSRGR